MKSYPIIGIMKIISGIVLAAILASSLQAQRGRAAVKSPSRLELEKFYVGPTLGLGSIGGADMAFGLRGEYLIKALPSLDNGKLGIAAAVDYYGFSGFGYSLSYIPVGLTANYHFALDEPEWDPFIGLGIGYSTLSTSGSGYSSKDRSENYMIARGGFRYFFKPGVALQVDAGTGSAAYSIGVMWKL